MSRFFAGLLACALAFPLLAASPSLIVTPTVVVFPFQVNGGAERDSGARVATIVANRIATIHDVTVKPVPAVTDRAHYLEAARAAGVDYYVTGYLTPLGNEVSVVEQVVSTQSGIAIYSGTAQLLTYDEAPAQGDVISAAILHHALRDIGIYTAPTSVSQAVPTVAPTGRAVADVAGVLRARPRRGRALPGSATPVPQPIVPVSRGVQPPVPAIPSPFRNAQTALAPPVSSLPTVPPDTTGASNASNTALRGYALAAIGGTSAAERKSYAATRLHSDFVARRAEIVDAGGPSPEGGCGANGIAAFVTAGLATRAAGRTSRAVVDLTVVDCSNAAAYRRSFAAQAGRDGMNAAIDRAVDQAVDGYFASLASRRR